MPPGFTARHSLRPEELDELVKLQLAVLVAVVARDQSLDLVGGGGGLK